MISERERERGGGEGPLWPVGTADTAFSMDAAEGPSPPGHGRCFLVAVECLPLALFGARRRILAQRRGLVVRGRGTGTRRKWFSAPARLAVLARPLVNRQNTRRRVLVVQSRSTEARLRQLAAPARLAARALLRVKIIISTSDVQVI